jgi:hypothetical protein
MWGNPIQAVGTRDFQTTVPVALHIEQAAIHPAMVLSLGTWARPSSELAWNIALTTLSLSFFYILFLSALPKFEHALEVNFLISPFIISFFAMVFGPVVLRSKFPTAFFGLQTANWKSATGFSFLGACPLYASGGPRRVSLTARVARVVSGNRRPCLEGHGRQRGQSPPLSQLQQIVGGADNAPFALHIFEAP